jgi:hypothetical protein
MPRMKSRAIFMTTSVPWDFMCFVAVFRIRISQVSTCSTPWWGPAFS